MSFFTNITTIQIIGLVLLAAGAIISFTAKPVSKRFTYEHADLICKFIGLGAAIAGFLIFFI